MTCGSTVETVTVWVGVGMLRHAQPLEMMLDANVERQVGTLALVVVIFEVVDVVVVILRLASTSPLVGFGMRCSASIPRFLFPLPSTEYEVTVTVDIVAVLTVEVKTVVWFH